MVKRSDLTAIELDFMNAAWDPERWPAACDTVAQAIGARGAVILPMRGTAPVYAFSSCLTPQAELYFQGGWYQRDDRTKLVPKLMSQGVAVESDYITEAEMDRSAYHQDFLAKVGLRYFVGLRLNAGDDVWCLAVQRTPLQGPVTKVEELRVRRWMNRLSAAATLSVQLSGIKAATMSNLLDKIGKAAILLDRTGRVVGANSLAEACFSPEFRIQRGHLYFQNPETSQTVSTALRTMNLPAPILRTFGPMRVDRGERSALSCLFLCLDGQDLSPFAKARIIVLIDDLKMRPTVPSSVLAGLFGLTPAEARLGEALSDGTALKPAAELLNVTHETARTQLKSLFAKTDVSRQSELVALVSRLTRIR